MRICMLSRAYVTNSSGGMEDYTQKLCEGLINCGHEVSIITSKHPKGIKYEKYNGVEIYYIDNQNPLSYKGYFTKAYRQYKKLNSIKRFDILHSQSSAALAFIFNNRIPMVTTMHGNMFTESQLNPNIFKKKSLFGKTKILISLYKRLIIHVLTKLLLIKSNYIIVASNFSKKKFSNDFIKDKIMTIYHGIDDKLLWKEEKVKAKKQLDLDNRFVLLCLGRLIEEKGIQIVLDSLSDIGNLYSEMKIELVVIGKGPYENNLKEMASRLGLNNVRFVGFIDDSEKYLYYSAADIFVYPELTSPAFGLVAAEAMACGTVVISARHDATMEVIGDDERFLFDVANKDELTQKIIAFLSLTSDEKEYYYNSFYERQQINFSYERMINKTSDLYHTCI